jgi:hypothetical protein
MKRERYRVEDRGYATPCWTWLLSKNNKGYGRVVVRGRLQLAHRHYHEEKHGPIPEGLTLDHLCRNTDCVNPDHTEAVTHAVNCRRGAGVRLSMETANQIRTARAATGASYRALAAQFDTDYGTVGRIIRGTLWA